MTPIVVSGPRFSSAGTYPRPRPTVERHLQLALVGDVRDLELRVQDLEVGGRLDVSGGDDAGTLLRDVDLDLG